MPAIVDTDTCKGIIFSGRVNMLEALDNFKKLAKDLLLKYNVNFAINMNNQKLSIKTKVPVDSKKHIIALYSFQEYSLYRVAQTAGLNSILQNGISVDTFSRGDGDESLFFMGRFSENGVYAYSKMTFSVYSPYWSKYYHKSRYISKFPVAIVRHQDSAGIPDGIVNSAILSFPSSICELFKDKPDLGAVENFIIRPYAEARDKAVALNGITNTVNCKLSEIRKLLIEKGSLESYDDLLNTMKITTRKLKCAEKRML